MKRLATVLGILFLSGAITAPVLAHGPGYGPGPGAGWSGGARGYWGAGPGSCWTGGGNAGTLTGEQREKLDSLYQKFRDDTAQTRSDLWNKYGELNRLLNSENPDPAKAKALQNEISELRTKMAQARIDLELGERNIAPAGSYGPGYGRGYGPGMWGYGHHMMGGYGPGMGYGYPIGRFGPGRMGPMGPRWSHMGGYGPGSCWN